MALSAQDIITLWQESTMKFTVLLNTGTVGTIDSDTLN